MPPSLVKQIRLRRLTRQRQLLNFIFISMGVVFASIGLKGFLLPNQFMDGGATGVALLLEIITGVEVSVFIVLVNIPFILLGARQVSRPFAVRSAIAILTLAVVVHFLEVPVITEDKLLTAVFGGFFLGAGIGCSIRGSAVIDGTEVMAVATSRNTSLTVGDFLALFNAVLFGVAAFFVSIETAMYSMLTYLAASKTVDFIINGIEEYIGVTIVSDQAREIKQMMRNEMGLAVTVFKAGKPFTDTLEASGDRYVLFCVVTRLKVTRLLFEISKIDEKPFITQHIIQSIRGGMVKKRPLH